MSATLAAVTTTVCTSLLARSAPMCAFIPKYHWLPFLVWCISGSRCFSLFLVEDGAAISVASTNVPYIRALLEQTIDAPPSVSKACSDFRPTRNDFHKNLCGPQLKTFKYEVLNWPIYKFPGMYFFLPFLSGLADARVFGFLIRAVKINLEIFRVIFLVWIPQWLSWSSEPHS